MKVEVLKCFKDDNGVYGEYYVYDANGNKFLVFQNEMDIKVVTHFKGKKIEDCIVRPTQKVIDAVTSATITYLQEKESE